MRYVAYILIACLALLWHSSASAAGSKYKDAIVGKWQNTKNAKSIIEFTKDGKLIAGPFTGTYTLDEKDTLLITTAKPFNGLRKFTSKVSITKDVMTLIDPDGTKAIWKRVK
jgi:hypothetical protein